MDGDHGDEDGHIDRFETLLLDWSRTVAIFFIVGIALYNFTPQGKYFAIMAFIISIIMIATMLVDYFQRRYILMKHGHSVRLALDILAMGMLLALALVIMMTYHIIILPPPKEDFDHLIHAAHLHFP